MNRFRLHPPQVSRRSVRFRWEVEPRTNLYRAHSFTLRFPESCDIERVPESLWWTIAMICLHAHWTILRPCRVELPVTLDSRELEFWRRLLQSEVTTLEGLRGNASFNLGIEIDQTGPRLSPPAPLPDSGRCATAFSGGKDSLLQAGLLAELTADPILVTTTSPMPPLQDHVTGRRRQILNEIAGRRAVTLVEVESSFRASWDNHFADRQGYPIAVNEMTDAFLYLASLLAAGASLGATHLFLASEAEVQQTVERGGHIVQHKHYMYSVATQRALQALLAPLGFRYSSLTSPLHSDQVQRLLWSRYADLADLQYSCWRVQDPEATCSACSQCFRIAMTSLAMGQNPRSMGIDLIRLLRAQAGWAVPDSSPNPDLLPTERVAHDLHCQIVRSIAQTPRRRVAKAIRRSGWRRAVSSEGRQALRAYGELRRRCASRTLGDAPGYRAGYLKYVDPLLRDKVAKVYARSFREQSPAEYEGLLSRTDVLARWTLEPLGGAL